ncbi:MAG: LysR family transcriptional regulator [Lachnospiraceae bacterium]|nr:LysR family transcriptional regulator [Lachnospiraceae bacterium]
MDMKQLRSFVEVARLRQFTEASNRVHLSQPAVSTQIRALERELGVDLLERTTKRVTLTEKGELFYSYALRMLELEQTALEKLSDSMGQMITLGASTIPSSYLLPQILSGYRSENAGCFFRVLQSDSHTAVSQVLDGTVDFSVVGEVPDNPALTIREICRDQLLIVTPVNEHYMTLKHHTPSLQQLFQEPVILRESGSGTQKNFDRFLERHHIHKEDLHVAACANDLEAIRKMIVSGMGISMMSACSVRDLAGSGQVLVYQMHEDISRHFYIVWQKRRSLTDSERNFIGYLEKNVPR